MEEKIRLAVFGQKRLSREGGIEIVVKELCTRMAQNGCDITCYNRAGHHVSGAEYDKTIEYDGIRQKVVPTIYFNFVGRFVPPAFGEVELTPEELEEIRKREERKDRLHQNYLKRKASGAQKRYEDKIKERKKAEIEAKKAAIRAEDIAKGVFVPVSSLPQREPQKGAQIA